MDRGVWHSGTMGQYRIDFDFPVTQVGGWFCADYGTVYLEAYDAGGALVASNSLGPNYGSNSYLSVSDSQGRTEYVIIHDTSNYWSVDDLEYTPAHAIRIIQPNGGESWAIGSRQNISWVSSGVAGNVNIYLSRDGGSSWQTIASETSNDGTESWRVVGAPTALAKIKIASVTDATIFDISDTSFTITTLPAQKLTLRNLKITDTNLNILNSYPAAAWDPVAGSSSGYEKLLWDFGQQLDVANASKGPSGIYTQLADNNGYLPGECVSAVKALSRNSTLTRDWVMGDSVIAGGIEPGTAIATFFAPGNKYPSEGGGHTAILKSYIVDDKGKIIGFYVWDQNWDFEGVVGSHAIYRSGKGVADADSYNVVKVP